MIHLYTKNLFYQAPKGSTLTILERSKPEIDFKRKSIRCYKKELKIFPKEKESSYFDDYRFHSKIFTLVYGAHLNHGVFLNETCNYVINTKISNPSPQRLSII